ncbi:isochorismate synthase MenF [Acerihabitans sp. TG2]|uniref:isochorismate synthase MenF n=1 Tax=Acerihabitans sp. TG2 TaxID=3096008 RepID=UPI002B22882B|nr:isochorismate synthase MenF [Acerihabitans sp. TG2]MEA9389170.1 isochorismate synthase MenF [Acerihabitans sp. TG2]
MLSLLKTSLQQHIDAGIPADPGVYQITISWSPGAHVPMLDWLNSSTLYPQFYWQDRQGAQETAACGQLVSFSRLTQAEAFLAEYAATPSLRLWGLNAFGRGDGEPESYLFLPRLIWQRERQNHVLILNLASRVSLNADAREFLATLEHLAPTSALRPWSARLLDAIHQPTKRHWQQLVSQALKTLGQGELTKVVLARRTRLVFDGELSPAALMAASRRVNHDAYHFMLAWSPTRAFLGSTPERLYRRRHDCLDTEALAGTVASYSPNATPDQLADWLMNDDKNQRENLLVVDDICQRLRPAALSLDVMPPEIVRLRTVQHLRRSIQARLTCASDARCLSMLQPTAAVAGLPRGVAREFIARHEPFDRQWYAGSAGYLSTGQAEFCVSLRCALLEQRELWLYAGAGIVDGSDADQEWREVDNKAASMRTLFVNGDGNHDEVA